MVIRRSAAAREYSCPGQASGASAEPGPSAKLRAATILRRCAASLALDPGSARAARACPGSLIVLPGQPTMIDLKINRERLHALSTRSTRSFANVLLVLASALIGYVLVEAAYRFIQYR